MATKKQKTESIENLIAETLYRLNRNGIVENSGEGAGVYQTSVGAPHETLQDEALDESSADAGVEAFASAVQDSRHTEQFIKSTLDAFIIDFAQNLGNPVVRVMKQGGMDVSIDDLMDVVHGPAGDQIHDLVDKLEEDLKSRIKTFMALYAEVIFRAMSGNDL